MMTLYPLKLSRHLSPRLWGGAKLQSFLSIEDYAEPEPLGESWQVYEKNSVTAGPLAGKTLAELCHHYGAALTGTASFARYGASFPLLAKFIDADDRLSIQVHPDDDYAQSHEAATGFHGKAEAWLVLEAEAGASIIWGFKERVSKNEVRQAVREGSLETLVNTVPVAAGEVIYNPPGTLHAIGAGILLFEIQQSSDLTYRLYDYGRKDAKGKLRDLHIDKALEVLDYTPGERAKVSPQPLGDNRSLLVKNDHFAMERWEFAGELEAKTAPTSVEIVTLLGGEAELSAGRARLTLAQGESCVLPASLGDYRVAGQALLLRCYVPG